MNTLFPVDRGPWKTSLSEKNISFPQQKAVIIDRVALAKQGDNALGSVRPSVRPFACQRSHG